MSVDQDAADQEAFSQQYDAQQAAAKQAEQDKQQPPSFFEKWAAPVGRVTTEMIDGAVSAADSMYDTPGMRKARDVVAGGITGAVNIADAAKSAADRLGAATDPYEQKDPYPPTSPIWDHAKSAILDFRDAVVVQDPTLADNLTQGISQLAIPFAGYSRALAGLHGVANGVIANALTDATALGPHDGRLADIIALGRHTEGKLGEALRTLAPDGSAVNAYINFLTDRGNETEAEGRFKNVLDGFGANLIFTPLMHAAAVVLKQGTAALRYAANAGVSKLSDLLPPKPAAGDAAEAISPYAALRSASKVSVADQTRKPGQGWWWEDPEQWDSFKKTLNLAENATPDEVGAAVLNRVKAGSEHSAPTASAQSK